MVQSIQPVLHIFEGDVSVHVGGCARRSVTELLLDLPEVASLLEQVNGQRVSSRMYGQFLWQARPLYSRLPDLLKSPRCQWTSAADKQRPLHLIRPRYVFPQMFNQVLADG